ncbi:MAG: ROK family transcriptional regulator [Acidobacteria bacterium]|nr:MAG: ROK family transcriptional regulator [Acidobacteriota bacterium]
MLGRPRLLRDFNAQQILRLLRKHGPCSRADLARYSGLSAPTISSGVAYLKQHGLIEPMGPGPSSGGRPPDLLRFNSKVGYVAGVDIGTSLVRIALADLDGTIIEKVDVATHSQSTPDHVVSLIATGIRKLQARHRIPAKKLVALAAGVPGITDVQKGIVLSAPILAHWQAVPLREILAKRVGAHAVVENDVNLAALGEGRWGIARGVKNFVFLTVGSGIGAGIFINGHLYHGADWAAGEIGYLYVPGTEESPLAILKPGPLEDMIGARAIESAWRKLEGQGSENGRGGLEVDGGGILDLAEKGYPLAGRILQQTARILADAVTNICVVLNPSLVVLGGRVGSRPALFKATSRIIECNEFCRPRVAVSKLATEAAVLGAVQLALNVAEQKILPDIEKYDAFPSEGRALHQFED